MGLFRMYKLSFAACLALLVLALSSCTGGGLKIPQAPTIGVSGLQLVSPGLQSQTFRLGLDLKNPNNFLLPLRGFNYTLKLNGIEVAQGVNSDLINIPAGGNSALQMDISMNLLTLFGRLKGAGLLSGKPLKYELSGNVGVLNQALTLPFSRVGQVAVSQ